MKLSEKIYTCRKKAGFSQEALAEKLGVSRQAVSKWETGEAVPELSKLAQMTKIFGVTADWLISEEDGVFPTIIEEEPIPPPEESNTQAPAPNGMRHLWIVGVVIAAIGAWIALIAGVILLIIFTLTTNTHSDSDLLQSREEIDVVESMEIFITNESKEP